MEDKTIKGVVIQKIKNDLIKTTFADKTLLNATKLEDLRKVYTKIHGNEDLSGLRLLNVFKGTVDIPIDIGERYISNRIRKKIGEAFVADNPITVEWVKGASALMSQVHPVKVFQTEDEAINWLENL